MEFLTECVSIAYSCTKLEEAENGKAKMHNPRFATARFPTKISFFVCFLILTIKATFNQIPSIPA